jgi:hypothetical protein
MACHEIAGLRLGLMNVLGVNDEREKQHELAELGKAATAPGPIAPLIKAQTLADLKRLYAESLIHLAEKVSKTSEHDPKLGYYRALMVTTKKIELELNRLINDMNQFYKELDEVHDYLHEVFPR